MPEKTPAPPESVQTGSTPEPAAKKGKTPGKWFQKIPKGVLFSPGGAVLIFFAGIMEIIDWIPLPGLDSLTWELILELIFIIFLVIIAKVSLKSLIIPFIIERLPVISDILPTWLLRMFL